MRTSSFVVSLVALSLLAAGALGTRPIKHEVE